MKKALERACSGVCRLTATRYGSGETSGFDGTKPRVDTRHRAAALLGILGELRADTVKRGAELRRFRRHVPKASIQGGLGDRLGRMGFVHGTQLAFECLYNARDIHSVYTTVKIIYKNLTQLPRPIQFRLGLISVSKQA